MKSALTLLISFLMILLISASALAAPTIGGYFSEAEWTIEGVQHFAKEDWVAPNGYVGPGYGGQEFDVEYLGLFIDDNHLYFGLQTGFELNYGEAAGGHFYLPGDIALGFNPVDTLPEQRTYQFGFRFSGFEYQGHDIQGLNDSQYHLSGVQYVAELKTYFNPQWSDPSLFPDSGPFRVEDGEEPISPDPEYVARYKRFGGSSGDPYRNTLEASISLASISNQLSQIINPGSSYDVTIHWTMGCGNDYLDQTFTFNAPQPIPEPATMLLLGAGLACFAGTRKKFKK